MISNSNENEYVYCPSCKSDDRIDVLATMWVNLLEDGTDPDEAHCHDQEFSDESPAYCGSCRWEGIYGEVQHQNPPA